MTAIETALPKGMRAWRRITITFAITLPGGWWAAALVWVSSAPHWGESRGLSESRWDQNPYSPEFMRPGRGRIEVVTKAGASAYHGTSKFVFRDNRINAREPFAATRPQEQRRIVESSLTGPIGSGKTSSFLFAGTFQSEAAQSIVFAIDPSGEVRANVPSPQRQADLSARLSHQLGTTNTIAIRYEALDQYTKNQGVGGVVLPEAARNFRNREDLITYTQTTTFTPKLLNDFRILFGKEYQPTRSIQSGPKIVVLDAFTRGGAQADRLQTEYHTVFHDAMTLPFTRCECAAAAVLCRSTGSGLRSCPPDRIFRKTGKSLAGYVDSRKCHALLFRPGPIHAVTCLQQYERHQFISGE